MWVGVGGTACEFSSISFEEWEQPVLCAHTECGMPMGIDDSTGEQALVAHSKSVTKLGHAQGTLTSQVIIVLRDFPIDVSSFKFA